MAGRADLLVLLAAAAVTVSGCGGLRQAIGAAKVTPDEFRVVTRAPLVVPPDYALRPPKPGDPRPQELRPDQDARAAVFGSDYGAKATEGEKLLVTKAHAEAVDPSIRAQVDLESAALVRKDEGFANKVLFFRNGKPTAPEGQPLNADAERERLEDAELTRRATGGGEVIIQRAHASRIKLPGL
jgi:hypothetical protein